MDIQRIGSRPSGKGSADWFTGAVRIDPMFDRTDPSAGERGASVTFEPGARTAWHTHPLGQSLIVTAGCGWKGAEMGWGEGRDSAGGCGLVCGGGKALARGDGDDGDDASCGSGEAGREGGRLDGEGE